MSEPPDKPKGPDTDNPMDVSVSNMVVATARRLAVYACENLGLLIYTRDGDVRLPEVHEHLRAHLIDGHDLTNDDLAEALEQAGEKYMSLDIIDDLLAGIENRWLRSGVNIGVGLAKRMVHRYPDFVEELQEKKSAILLQFLAMDSSTAETFKLLQHRPKLTRFITEALMVKMGVPLTAPPAPAGRPIVSNRRSPRRDRAFAQKYTGRSSSSASGGRSRRSTST